MTGVRFGFVFALVVALPLIFGAPVRAEEEYEIGASDLLRIVVLGQPEMSGEFAVEVDGLLNFPLLGKVKASEMTTKDLEKKLTALLADGYLKRPQVSVLVKEYRSQRVFVTGAVSRVGPYALKADRSLFALLADLGNMSPEAGREVVVTRAPRKPAAPRMAESLPEDVVVRSDSPFEPAPVPEVIRVDLQDLQSGLSDKNVMLRAGDTVNVPRASQVYISGYVVRPGPFRYVEGTTVLQALSQAGGVTDRGASGRVKIVRIVDGKKVETKANLTDLVQPEDMIVVPERFF
jgi:polysaccharide export outer membrane protein